MGAQNGKFYDQNKTNIYFNDVNLSFATYKAYADEHAMSRNKIVTTEYWEGLEADTAKKYLSSEESILLDDILALQNDMTQLQNDIMEKFSLEVDANADARIEYDVLSQIMTEFQKYYLDYVENTQNVLNQNQTLRGSYSKYYSFTEIDPTASNSIFVEFCGGNDTTNGFLYECMQKLVNFDESAKALILERGLDLRMQEIYTRVVANLGRTLSLSDLTKYTSVENLLRNENKEIAEVESILAKQYWTEDEAITLAQYYKTAIENEDTELLEAFYNGAMTQYLTKNENGDYTYIVGMDYEKVNAIAYTLFNNCGVDANSEIYRSLCDLSSISAEVDTNTPPKFNLYISTNSCGMVVNWTIKQNGEEIISTQRMIFKEDAYTNAGSEYDILQSKYDAISDLNGLTEYRNYLKTYKDFIHLAELESVAGNSDFETLSQYGDSTYTDSFLGIKYDTKNEIYEYINNVDIGYRIREEMNGGEGIRNGYENMTEEQVAIYNYLYATDKKKAEDYLTLLTPYLRNESAQKQYEMIKDSGFMQTMYGIGAGMESLTTGIGNIFGANDDLDGIPMATVVSIVDSNISANATGALKYTYGASKMLGMAAPAIIIGVGTGGAGFAAEAAGVAATATIYGMSAGGNAYTYAAQSGYTMNQAINYGWATGSKEFLKTGAMSMMGIGILKGGNAAGWKLGTTSLAMGTGTAGLEFLDEALISPYLGYYSLNDPRFLEVNYWDAAKNSAFAGFMAGGTVYMRGLIAQARANRPYTYEEAIQKLDGGDFASMSNSEMEKCLTAVAKSDPELANSYIDSAFREKALASGYSQTTIDNYLKAVNGDIAWDAEAALKNQYGEAVWKALPEDTRTNLINSQLHTDAAQLSAMNTKYSAMQTMLEFEARYSLGYYDSANYSVDDIIEMKIAAKQKGAAPVASKDYSSIANGSCLPEADVFVSDEAVLNYVKKLCPDSVAVQNSTNLQELANVLAADPQTVTFVTFQDATPGANNIVKFDGAYGYSDIQHGGAFAVPESALATYAEQYPNYCSYNSSTGEFKITNFEAFGSEVLSGVPLTSDNGAYLIKTEVPLNSTNIRMPSIDNGSSYMSYFVSGGALLSGQTEATLLPIQTTITKTTTVPTSGITGSTSGINYSVTIIN